MGLLWSERRQRHVTRSGKRILESSSGANTRICKSDKYNRVQCFRRAFVMALSSGSTENCKPF